MTFAKSQSDNFNIDLDTRGLPKMLITANHQKLENKILSTLVVLNPGPMEAQGGPQTSKMYWLKSKDLTSSGFYLLLYG